jgi:ParB-like chromosome segregation protein Spo0J
LLIVRSIPLKHINEISKKPANNPKVKTYRDKIRNGEHIDPIQVRKSKGLWGKGKYDLFDGHHRYAAHEAEGKRHIKAVEVD